MKKKLLCMFLCIIMMLSFVLTSCSVESGGEDTVVGEEDLTEEADRTPVTLTFWLPAETAMSEETVAAVEAAMNDYLKSNFTTAVELKIFDEETYEKEMLGRIDAIEKKAAEEAEAKRIRREMEREARRRGETLPPLETESETVVTEVETVKNEWGVKELKYPAVNEDQFDIFLITDYNMYLSLADRDALSELDTSLAGSSKVLRSYINSVFFETAKFNGTTYAIPNNHGLGEYKYLLLNKELIEKYSYDADTFGSSVAKDGNISSLEEFIRDIERYEDLSAVTPLLSWVEPAGMYYWSLDGSWSVLSSMVKSNDTFSTLGSINSIFKNNAYKSNFKLMKAFEEDGLIAEDPAACENFAVGVVSCDLDQLAAYEENYYVYTYEAPMITQEDVFAGAFAVSSYTENLDRAMEVITALNTDVRLRDILQYGAPDIHFEYNEDEQVVRLNDDYTMNPLHTGNTFVMSTEAGTNADVWESQKQTNLSAHYTPFTFCPNLRNEENAQYYADLAKLSADLYKQMMEISLEDVDTFFSDAHAQLTENDAFNKMEDPAEWEFGVSFIYNTFYTDNFAPEEVAE